MAPSFEVNFDGLIGPTHNYAGLAHGNVASMQSRGAVSNPRAAALQGLAKMKLLANLGLKQAVLPPHERPHLGTLRACGFRGSDAVVLRAAARQAPELLRACASASNMWVANAATMAPSADTRDGRVHFTVANLASNFHRAIEAPQTARTLRAIFRDATKFVIHAPVPSGQNLGDEGAANHTRLAAGHGQRGLHFFVYGHRALSGKPVGPGRFSPRQAWEASHSVARNHWLDESQLCFAQQSPEAVNAGVFHNDVISVGNEHVLLYHERAFVDSTRVIGALRRKFANLAGEAEFLAIPVPESRVSLVDAVRSYLFNAQLVTVGPGRMALIAPLECEAMPGIRAFIDEILSDGRNPVREVHYVKLQESMRNGGGPACLRLRVTLTGTELQTLPPKVMLTPVNYKVLTAWVKKHYREELRPGDLADPHLLEESRRALDELTGLLALGSIYPFQTAAT